MPPTTLPSYPLYLLLHPSHAARLRGTAEARHEASDAIDEAAIAARPALVQPAPSPAA